MGTTTNPAPGGIDLHEEVSLKEVKLDVSQETKATYKQAYANLPVQAPAPEPQLRESVPVTFDDFVKVDFRVGTVRAAVRVPKSDKLLQMQVTFGGMGERQVLAGIGKTFEPDALVGKQFIFVVNLPPRKMMGLESHGMILATGPSDALVLVSPSAPTVDGSRLG